MQINIPDDVHLDLQHLLFMLQNNGGQFDYAVFNRLNGIMGRLGHPPVFSEDSSLKAPGAILYFLLVLLSQR